MLPGHKTPTTSQPNHMHQVVVQYLKEAFALNIYVTNRSSQQLCGSSMKRGVAAVIVNE